MKATFIVVSGKANKSEVVLNLPSTIGRSRESDLMVSHPMVSRHHCEVFESDGQVMIRDLGSTNGTLIGGDRITEAALPSGSELTVGPLTFRVEYETEPMFVPEAAGDDEPDFTVDAGTAAEDEAGAEPDVETVPVGSDSAEPAKAEQSEETTFFESADAVEEADVEQEEEKAEAEEEKEAESEPSPSPGAETKDALASTHEETIDVTPAKGKPKKRPPALPTPGAGRKKAPAPKPEPAAEPEEAAAEEAAADLQDTGELTIDFDPKKPAPPQEKAAAAKKKSWWPFGKPKPAPGKTPVAGKTVKDDADKKKTAPGHAAKHSPPPKKSFEDEALEAVLGDAEEEGSGAAPSEDQDLDDFLEGLK